MGLTQERLKELLHYDPETGVFTWRKSQRVAGCSRKDGYLKVQVCNRQLCAHRLVFLYVDGFIPSRPVDHINGVRADNRYSNLRVASPAINSQNRTKASSNNLAGLLGVSDGGSEGRFKARISAGGVSVNLGVFATPELAHEAYAAAKRRLHEGCTI